MPTEPMLPQAHMQQLPHELTCLALSWMQMLVTDASCFLPINSQSCGRTSALNLPTKSHQPFTLPSPHIQGVAHGWHGSHFWWNHISTIDLLNLKIKFYEAVVKHSDVEPSMLEAVPNIQSIKDLQKARVANDMLKQMQPPCQMQGAFLKPWGHNS